MPSFCSVVGCAKRGNRDEVRFFRIPAALKDRGIKLDALSKERRECWIRSLKRGELSETFLKNARICSDHFLTGQPAALEDRLNIDWIPTQNMGYVTSKTKSQDAVQRHKRSTQRASRLNVKKLCDSSENMEPIAGPSTEPQVQDYEHSYEQEGKRSVAVQTDEDMEYLNKLFSDLSFCNEKIHSLNQKVKAMDLSEESFLNNDSKAVYFTGFPKAEMMFAIYNSVAPNLSTKSVLSPFKQFLLTLMRLRLNLPFKYLSYRFSVSPATSSDTFYKCIDIFYEKFKKLVIWPDREILRKNMPACFKENFGDRIAVIIDCFEIFTEKPSALVNASQCWSNYKHHETIKCLIGITPQGTISYISEAWGGRTGDKHLTENCGFLNLILPGDVILADRGFLIKDSVEILGAHLEIPAFTKGRNQLHPLELESTRNIANVRIHVERIIGLLRKKFNILRGPIPISMLSVNRDDISALDKVLVICSAFINLCPSQIPMD